MLSELSVLGKSIDHIKEIVKVQQAYAKSGGLEEDEDIRQLIEMAIEISLSSLERHGVSVECNFADIPVVRTDRRKVLQILINFISNAKHALLNAPEDRRRLVIATRVDEDGMLALDFIDNGKGIAEENMPRLFEHGFSTKSGGHGFGLHSAALAADQLGGRIDVASDGEGQGARFSLCLPINKKGAAETRGLF